MDLSVEFTSNKQELQLPIMLILYLSILGNTVCFQEEEFTGDGVR